METIKFIVPTWALSAIINDDCSGLNKDETVRLNHFLDKIKTSYKPGIWGMPKMSESGDMVTNFLGKNDIDGYLGAECVELDYVIQSHRKFSEMGSGNPYLDQNWNDRTAKERAKRQ